MCLSKFVNWFLSKNGESSDQQLGIVVVVPYSWTHPHVFLFESVGTVVPWHCFQAEVKKKDSSSIATMLSYVQHSACSSATTPKMRNPIAPILNIPQNGPLNHVFWGVFRIKGLPSNMDDKLMLKPTEVCGSKQALNLDRQHRRSTMWRRAKCLRTKLWTRLPCNRTGASAGSWPLSVSAGVNEQWDTSQPVSK